MKEATPITWADLSPSLRQAVIKWIRANGLGLALEYGNGPQSGPWVAAASMLERGLTCANELRAGIDILAHKLLARAAELELEAVSATVRMELALDGAERRILAKDAAHRIAGALGGEAAWRRSMAEALEAAATEVRRLAHTRPPGPEARP